MDLFLLSDKPEETSKIIDFFIQVFASLIGAGAAVGVYWHNNKKTREKGANDRKRFEKDKLRYLHHLLKGSQKQIDSYVIGLGAFINDLRTAQLDIGSIHMSPSFDIDRVTNKINREEHFHAYRNRIKNSRITEIFNIIDFINVQQSTIINDLEGKKISKLEKLEVFRSNFVITRDLLESVLNGRQDSTLPIFDELTNLRLKLGVLLTSHNGNFPLLQSEFLQPLISIFSPYASENIDIIFIPLIKQCVFTNSQLDNIKRDNLVLAADLQMELNKAQEASNNLTSNMQNFDDYIQRINFPKQ